MPRTVTEIDPKSKEKILGRLRSIEGHISAVIRMVEADRYCMDVLKQTQAIQSAISRANALLLERHLNHCVSSAIRSEDPRERERVISELLEIFENGRPR
jgi:CsoR family transcriptional regulator, copper-sensing transcriptional repressor